MREDNEGGVLFIPSCLTYINVLMKERPNPTFWHEAPLPHAFPLWNDFWRMAVVLKCNDITMFASLVQEAEHIRTLHRECWGAETSGM